MKYIKRTFFSLSAVAFFAAPLFAYAALVPCGKTGESMCTLCDIILGIYVLVDWAMKIMVFAAIVSITIGGILYIVSMGNPGLMGMAKNAIKYAVIGVVVILCAVLIVNTVMRVLATREGLGISPTTSWRTFECQAK